MPGIHSIPMRALFLTLFAAMTPLVLLEAAEPSVLVVNKGVGGATTQNGLARFERDVNEVRPDHLVLYFGVNDACNQGKWISVEQYEKNLETMIDRSPTKSVILVTPNVVDEDLLKLRHPRHPHKDSLSEHLSKYDAAVRRVAERRRLPLVDLRALTRETGGASGPDSLVRNRENSRSKDGVHLTAEGYRRFAMLFEPVFEERIEPGDVVVCLGDSITYGAHMAGAGTATGETYPAWLSVTLNRMVGAWDRTEPPAPPERDPDSYVANGGFEQCSDRVHADGWRVWNAPGRQVGEIVYHPDAPGAAEGTAYMTVIAPEPDKPAYFLTDRERLARPQPLRLRFMIRGEGEVRPLVNSVVKGTRGADAWCPLETHQWTAATGGWREHSFDYQPPERVRQVGVFFRVKGRVDFDGISLRPPVSPPPGRAGSKRRSELHGHAKFSKVVKPSGASGSSGAGKESLKLANDSISVRFAPIEAGAGFLDIVDARGYDFVPDDDAGVLWELELLRIPGPDDEFDTWAELSFDPEQNDGAIARRGEDEGSIDRLVLTALSPSASRSVRCRGDSLVFEWKGVDVGAEKSVLDVTVTATLAPDDSFARFRTSFENRSRAYTVFYVKSPFVKGVKPADGRGDLDWLASPIFNGRLMKNPVANGILGFPERFQPNRSGHSMQFDSWTHDDHGLYLGVFDGQQNAKRYYLAANSRDGFSWSATHIPNNMKEVPQRWTVPYDTVLRCFQGDWYDACRIYRDWAIHQSWTSEGPLTTRKVTPKWFKEIDDWFMWNLGKTPKDLMWREALTETLSPFDIGLTCSYWGRSKEVGRHTHEFFPLDEQDHHYFSNARERGYPVMGYVQGIVWWEEDSSWERLNGIDHTVRNFYDQRVKWRTRHHDEGINAIAWPAEAWTDVLGETVEGMARAGFSAVYLDSFNHGGTYLNFNPLHSDDVGGGNSYIKQNQRLFETIRERARRVNPDFCFTSESFWEGNMAQVDGYLAVNTTNQMLKTGEILAIPMIHSVYHDYCVAYSAWVGRHDLQQPGARGYLAKFGQAFVWGAKPGWNQPAHISQFDNHEIAMASTLERLTAYRASKKFLVYGEMLRQPSFAKKPPMIEVDWYRAWSKRFWDIELPEVMRSMWRAPGGSLGVVLNNIGDEARTVTLRLEDPSYGLGDKGAPEWSSVYPEEDRNATFRRDGDGILLLTTTVAPRAPRVIEISLGR